MRKLFFLIPLIFVFSPIPSKATVQQDYQRAKRSLRCRKLFGSNELFKGIYRGGSFMESCKYCSVTHWGGIRHYRGQSRQDKQFHHCSRITCGFLEQGLKRQNTLLRSGRIFQKIQKAEGASDLIKMN